MPAVIDIGTLITRDVDICGDRPRIAGTRITVGRIATLWKQGLTPEYRPITRFASTLTKAV